MFTVKPEADTELLNKFSPKTDKATVLVYNENGEYKGCIAFEPQEDMLDIIGFELVGQDDIITNYNKCFMDIDLLMRSLGSYALNHGAFLLKCAKSEYFDFFVRYGFKNIDNYLTMDLKELFKPCKNCEG